MKCLSWSAALLLALSLRPAEPKKHPDLANKDIRDYRSGSSASGGSVGAGRFNTGWFNALTSRAKVYLYQKNVERLGPLERVVNVPTAFKHWAIVAAYLDEETGEPDRWELYEAGEEDGFVVASHQAISKSLAKKWLEEPGAKVEHLGTTTLNQRAVIAFCKEVTERKNRYSWNEQNCQQFVKEFTKRFAAGKFGLPSNAEESYPGQAKRLSEVCLNK